MTPTFRYNPAVHRAGVRDDGVPLPGAHHARRRNRRGAQRDRHRIPRCRRAGLARVQGALRAPARVGQPDARAVDRGPGDLRGRVLLDARRVASTTGPTSPIPVYIAAGGPMVARYAGRAGDGFICTSGKGMELYTDELIPGREGGRRQGRARRSTTSTG